MPRTKSEEKRSQIVRVAAELFEQEGYDRTSMNMVSERVGGSKQTLYSYFESKHELMREVLLQDVTEGVDMIIAAYRSEAKLKPALIKLGIAYLERRLSPEPIANIRIICSQAATSNLGTEFWDQILRPAGDRISTLFAELIRSGTLVRRDPWEMTRTWKGLIESDLFERRLLGAMREIDHAEVAAAAKSAAEAFLKIYLAGEKGTPRKS